MLVPVPRSDVSLSDMSLSDRYSALQKSIDECARTHQRDPTGIRLLAVSKKQPIDAISALIDLGQCDFAENTLQEALPKITAIQNKVIRWHYIGRVQSNKCKAIAQHFDWVHSITDARMAQRLNDARPETMAPLNVYIQINVSGERSKAGLQHQDELFALATLIAQLPRLKLIGLMTMAPQDADTALCESIFQRLAQWQKILSAKGIETYDLSMGMSRDYKPAIAQGSTCLRIGGALFVKQ